MTSRYEFGELIRKARQEAGFSQEQVASRMGVAKSMISFWEQGTRGMPAENIVGYCKAIGVDPNTVLGFIGDIHPQLQKRASVGADLHRYLECLHRRIREQQAVIQELSRVNV
jgi:transcriptional regulator with XRE-family HTH domain